jgi:tetratricopeptide (TPR) repeat protein
VYEAAAADPEKISEPLLKLGAEMVRAVVFLDQKWYYLSEDECTHYLENLDKAGPSIGSEFSYPIFPEATLNTPEAKFHQLRAAGLLMRGLCRQQSDREEEALEDYEDFLEDMGQGGVSNESVWLIGTYVSLKREKNEEALKYIAQLEQSDILGDKEKKMLSEAKGYIASREPDKALNSISDKLFMAKITYHYASALLEKTDGYKQLQQSETGKVFLQLPGQINSGYELMTSPVKSIIDIDSLGAGIDSLGSKAKNMVKDLFK